MGDLFGDERGEDLPPDLHQFVRGEVVLQQPFVGAALVRSGSGRHASLVLFPRRDHAEESPQQSSPHDSSLVPPLSSTVPPMPQKCRLAFDVGNQMRKPQRSC